MKSCRSALVSISLISAVALSACSSSKSSGSPATFTASANADCGRYSAQANAIAKPSGENLPQVSGYLKKVASTGQGEINALKSLKPPSQDEHTLGGILSSMQQQVDKVDQLASSLNNGNLGSAQSQLQQIQSTSSSLNQQFQSIGLTSCANS